MLGRLDNIHREKHKNIHGNFQTSPIEVHVEVNVPLLKLRSVHARIEVSVQTSTIKMIPNLMELI